MVFKDSKMLRDVSAYYSNLRAEGVEIKDLGRDPVRRVSMRRLHGRIPRRKLKVNTPRLLNGLRTQLNASPEPMERTISDYGRLYRSLVERHVLEHAFVFALNGCRSSEDYYVSIMWALSHSGIQRILMPRKFGRLEGAEVKLPAPRVI